MTAIPTRLAAGTVSKTTIDGSSSYLISNFTTQTDMSVIEWHSTRIPPRYAVIEETLSNSLRTNGYWETGFVLNIMTPLMVNYMRTTFFSGGGLSAPVTLKVGGVIISTAQYFTGVLHQPDWSQVAENAIGYVNVRWILHKGVDIT